jgi:hypothetical protein
MVVVVALLALMIGIKALQAGGGSGAHDPLTLAAIGFVLLAAFAIAEIGVRFGLPRVTGYILGGALLGPSVTNILSSRVVGEMRMFNTLALGLIAVGAGLELDFRQLVKVAHTNHNPQHRQRRPQLIGRQRTERNAYVLYNTHLIKKEIDNQ